MDVGRVIGTIVSTCKHDSLRGVQLCIVEPLDENLERAADPLIASEASSPRSTGEIVFFVAGGDAVYTHPDGRALPVDAAIVGRVEQVNL